jgi:opacity protein-like surface antigen
MRASIGFFAAATLLVSAPLLAEESDSGWYGGVSLGATKLESGLGFKDDAIGLGLLGGYQQTKYIGWEGEIQASGDAKDTVTSSNGPVSIKAKYDSWAIGIVARYPFAKRFTVFGRFLPMYGRYTADFSSSSQSRKQVEREGGYTVGAGASAQFGHVDLRLRYDLQRVNFEEAQEIEYPQRLGLDVLWRF